MKIIIDRALCIGAANCIAVAPQTFALDHESKAVIIDPQGNDDKTITEAAMSCPTKAIILEDDSGKRIFPL